MKKSDLARQQLIQEATDDRTSPKRLIELAKTGKTIARLVAANPNADPELLAKLTSGNDEEIRRAVAANPNAPTEVLLKLGAEFPQEFLDNPVFSLLLLENPNFSDRIPENTMMSLLPYATVPVSFIESAANSFDSKLHLLLAINPQTSRQVLEHLAHSRDDNVKEAVELHINYSEEKIVDLQKVIRDPIKTIIRFDRYLELHEIEEGYFQTLADIGVIPPVFFHRLAINEDENIRRVVAGNRHLSDRLLEKLARDSCVSVLPEVARNPKSPPKVLALLAKNEDFLVRLAVAVNPKTPVTILQQLANDCSSVREAVAKNQNTPVEILEKLVADKDKAVRDRVAGNPNLPVYLLEQLAGDVESAIAVAKNPHTPTYVLKQLAGYSQLDRSGKLRMSMAANPNTPPYFLEKLAKNCEYDAISDRLAINPNTPEIILQRLARSHAEQPRAAVASNPNIPINILERLAQEKYPRIVSAVAANPKTPVNMLEKLARDPDAQIRCSVAANSSTPVSVLEELGQDRNSKVLEEVAANPHIPVYLLEKLLPFLIPPDRMIKQAALRRFLAEKADNLSVVLEVLAQNLEVFARSRFFVFSHPQIPPRVLLKHCRSLAWLERCAIAQNPKTPIDTLKILAADGNRIVRAAAKANWRDRSP